MDKEIKEKWKEILRNYEKGGRISPHVFVTKTLWKIHISCWINKLLKWERRGGYEWVNNR